ncbi:hypothetical protein AERO8C_200022 [Aeromonas veronii]|uniref:Uncharacterized protein n=1 Tax=Aeromonas veronii TaxID=654 RepID=A0A653L5Q1_AERVE|nr:hypothetical protein AERO8C_200022 [Aeromonas veronii]
MGRHRQRLLGSGVLARRGGHRHAAAPAAGSDPHAPAGAKRPSGAGLQPDPGGDPAAALLRALCRPDDGRVTVYSPAPATFG